jgi:hypothetical protein
LQISTSPDTNLKFNAILERGSLDASNKFVSSAELVSRSNDAYTAAAVTLSGTTTAGIHRLSITAVGQTANTATDGASFPVYGSLVSIGLTRSVLCVPCLISRFVV